MVTGAPVVVQHQRAELMENVLRANVDVLKLLMFEGRTRVEDEIRAKGLTPTGGLMVRITVERWCEE